MQMRCLVPAVGLVVIFGIAPVYAGPCSSEITQIEQAVNQPNSQYGPTARQSVGAQDSQQPTPSSIAAAEKRADNHYLDVLNKAKTLDAANNSDCQNVVKELKLLVGMQ
jgi:protein-disulfide isomerase